ncbi:aldo/keto reductase [Clostridium botulinum]|uniref:aldo/keto reductase n=1 Tax=Clostridium botulinum TaxID=1491 RepID=UPI0013CB01AD|nr:aldo/keto reductase [Clostridium botulinum]MBN1074276.1 aldo/keto reductase [Clostridium botulinum]NFN18296.1 aldo/keto reductase [Clostridium botulinum]NFN49994.1 aldo/keto reductase [Clostridium botulinum]
MNELTKSVILSNKVKMPLLGFGTYKVNDGKEVINSVKEALKLGYRHIDTAAFYKNEDGVGIAIKESGIKREDIFLVSKVWNTEQGYEKTLKSFENSIKNLQTDYLDLFLIHWPQPLNKKTWKALEELYKENKVRAIGVSNFTVNHLKDLISDSEITPMVNQVEFHPKLVQEDLIKFCNDNNIQLEAWSPLMRGKIFEIEILKDIAKKYKKTVSQIVLRWDVQMGVVTIPKSITPFRIKENTEIFDFELTEEDMRKITKLDENIRCGSHPESIYSQGHK